MPYTDKATVVALHLQTLLKTFTPALADVFYGDTELIPRTPTVTIEAGNKQSELVNTGHKVDVFFNIVLMVYTTKLTNEHARQLEADQLLEDLEDFINADRTMGGLVIHGHISSTEQGMAVRNNKQVLRAARMTWTGRSRATL